jgi:heptose II phosphotransferase
MKIESKSYKDWNIFYTKEKEELFNLAKNIIDKKKIKILKEYKNTERNYVVKVFYKNEKYILKSSKNEINIPQRKYLSILKKGEAVTTLLNVTKIRDKGLKELYVPYLAMEKRNHKILQESYLITEFIDGEILSPYQDKRDVEMPIIVELLRKIHREGYWHGDANPSNFIASSIGVRIIDTKLKKDFFGYGKNYDMLTLDISALNVEEYYTFNRKEIGYWLAKFIKVFKQNIFIKTVRKLKKNLRKKGWKI